MTIRRLPEGTVNRIAAGEVVERPASVVKELVENAIDAGAIQIDVAIAGAGRDQIIIADDGQGMTRSELVLFFRTRRREWWTENTSTKRQNAWWI